jgi:hypothetical protein
MRDGDADERVSEVEAVSVLTKEGRRLLEEPER